MDPFSELSLEITRWLQANYSAFEPFLTAISNLVRFEIYLLAIPLVYWCLEKRLGRNLTLLIIFSTFINEFLKAAFRNPRPYWIEEDIGLQDEETYGVPSGHAQTATVLYLYLAAWFGRKWIWVMAIVLVFLTCLSRLYLGVHDIEDIVAGVIVGLLILSAFYLWNNYVADWTTNRILGQRLLIALSIPLLLGIIYIAVFLIIGEPDRSVVWASRIDAAESAAQHNIARAFGGLLGFTAGFVMEGSRVRFLTAGPVWRRILRYLVGISITVAIWAGLDVVFPDEPLVLDLVLTVLRYLVVALWIAYYAPMVFVRLRLADASPVQESTITI